MSDNEQFAIHMSMEYDGIDYRAACILGNNAIKLGFKGQDWTAVAFGLLNELSLNSVFDLLKVNRQLSMWPIPHAHQLLTGLHNHSPIYANPLSSMFDLHFECGERRNINGAWEGLYAKTQIGLTPNIKTFDSLNAPNSQYYEPALENVLVDLASNRIFDFLVTDPSSSFFPFCANQPKAIPRSAPVPAEIPQKDLPRKLPSAIIGVPHPQCQNVCTSWDHFGKVKCKNICAWRTEL